MPNYEYRTEVLTPGFLGRKEEELCSSRPALMTTCGAFGHAACVFLGVFTLLAAAATAGRFALSVITGS